jgi:hypothetical protein
MRPEPILGNGLWAKGHVGQTGNRGFHLENRGALSSVQPRVALVGRTAINRSTTHRKRATSQVASSVKTFFCSAMKMSGPAKKTRPQRLRGDFGDALRGTILASIGEGGYPSCSLRILMGNRTPLSLLKLRAFYGVFAKAAYPAAATVRGRHSSITARERGKLFG